jgi:hypothetical protein
MYRGFTCPGSSIFSRRILKTRVVFFNKKSFQFPAWPHFRCCLARIMRLYRYQSSNQMQVYRFLTEQTNLFFSSENPYFPRPLLLNKTYFSVRTFVMSPPPGGGGVKRQQQLGELCNEWYLEQSVKGIFLFVALSQFNMCR